MIRCRVLKKNIYHRDSRFRLTSWNYAGQAEDESTPDVLIGGGEEVTVKLIFPAHHRPCVGGSYDDNPFVEGLFPPFFPPRFALRIWEGGGKKVHDFILKS